MSKKNRERHTDQERGRQQQSDRSGIGNQQGTTQTGGQNAGGRDLGNQDSRSGNSNQSSGKRSSNRDR